MNLQYVRIVMVSDVSTVTRRAVSSLLHRNDSACIAKESDAFTAGLQGGLIPKENMTDSWKSRFSQGNFPSTFRGITHSSYRLAK